MTVRATPAQTQVGASGTGRATATSVPTLHEILDGAGHLTVVTDRDGAITFASSRSHDLLGSTPESLITRRLTDLIDPADRERVSETAGRVRARWGDGPQTVGFAALADTDRTRLLEADLTLLERSTAPGSLLWTIRRFGSRAASRGVADPVESAMHDELTDLPNRALLVESLDHALARHRRSHTLLATIVVAVEAFTATWEEVGHRAARDLLLTTATRLQTVVRPGDLVARVGVDEFAVVLDGVADADEAHHLGRRILAELAAPVDANGRSIGLAAAAGVSIADDLATRAIDLLERATSAADQARRVEPTWTPVSLSAGAGQTVHRDRDLVTDLADAIRENQIRPVYQPIIDLDSGVLCGFEALARWRHPDRGEISPAVFITIAEQTGLIGELGRHMLVDACQQLETWRQAHPEHAIRIGVNASPHQLVGRTVLDDVRRALKFSGLPPEHLILEVTESGLHRDLAGVRRLLGEVRELGARTAMDDFGTGYSSLAYLRRLPLDILKVDRSFIADRDPNGAGYLAAIVALGLELGLDTLAEGIEEPEQLAASRVAGCAFGQGFLIARPLETEAAGLLVGRPGPVVVPDCRRAAEVSAS